MIIIDRIERDVAVVETPDGMGNVPLSEIEGEPHDGDVLIPFGDRAGYSIDHDETARRRERISAKRRNLFNRN